MNKSSTLDCIKPRKFLLLMIFSNWLSIDMAYQELSKSDIKEILAISIIHFIFPKSYREEL